MGCGASAKKYEETSGDKNATTTTDKKPAEQDKKDVTPAADDKKEVVTATAPDESSAKPKETPTPAEAAAAAPAPAEATVAAAPPAEAAAEAAPPEAPPAESQAPAAEAQAPPAESAPAENPPAEAPPAEEAAPVEAAPVKAPPPEAPPAESAEDKEKAKLRQLFEASDFNKNGTVEAKELRVAMETLGMKMTDIEADMLYSSLDVNHDQHISFEEYTNLFKEAKLLKSGDRASLTERQLEKLKKLFEATDFDKTGTIEAGELKKCTEVLGMPMSDLEADMLFKALDHDNDKHVSFLEFTNLFHEARKVKLGEYGDLEERQVTKLQKLFEASDLDKGGFVEAKELKVSMKVLGMEMTDQEADALFKSMDVNHDSKLQFEEYKNLFIQAKKIKTGELSASS